MEWKINDKNCWICGKDENLTEHHSLPKHWNPKNNIVVPICEKCHKRLNEEDLAGMMQFAFKVEQELGRQVAMWGRLRVGLDKYVSMQQTILDAFKKNDKGGKE